MTARTHVLSWGLTLVLLAAAWGVVEVTLPDDAAQQPFPTTAEIGEAAVSRNLVVTVTDVRAAARVTDDSGWSADGTWLVVDLEASSQVTQENALLGLSRLIVGDRTFSATDRGTTFAEQRLVTGVPRSGSLAFELPADALTGTATLQLGVPTGAVGQVPLDGMITLTIDLDALEPDGEAALLPNGWAR
jgi:hypothetical protein